MLGEKPYPATVGAGNLRRRKHISRNAWDEGLLMDGWMGKDEDVQYRNMQNTPWHDEHWVEAFCGSSPAALPQYMIYLAVRLEALLEI